MVKTLVTGGAGFIGSHLVERLLSDGHEVTILDNLATGRMENLSGFVDHPALDFQNVDMTQTADLSAIFSGVKWVFHLAGLADIVPSIRQPIAYQKANVAGTVNILEAARTAEVSRFIYTASSSSYGIPDEFPTPETAEIRPLYPYALTKYLGEECALHWNKVYGMPTVSLRLFNVYGPRSRTTGAYGAVFGVLLAQKLAGKPLTIVGDGTQTRDFTFVTDVADAMVSTAQSNISGEALNVGSGDTYSINYLASLIGGDVVYIPKRPGEPDCTFADTRKIKELLGWRPQVKFEDGVGIMLDNIENWNDAPVWNPNTISQATGDWFKFLGNPNQNHGCSQS